MGGRQGASELESVMSESKPTGYEPAHANLRKALDSLRHDLNRIEFWADALESLMEPVPDYQVSDHISHHLLSPAQSAAKADH
jgi:hypothetical protein